jgi:hypothetical protein
MSLINSIPPIIDALYINQYAERLFNYLNELESLVVNTNYTTIAALPAFYSRDIVWAIKGRVTAADRYVLLSPTALAVNVGNIGYVLPAQASIDLSVAANWDTVTPTDYTVAATRAGKDFYVYACQQGSAAPKLVLSANSTVPSGYTADNSRKIAGFHCECVAIRHDLTLTAWAATTAIAVGATRKATVWDGYMYRCTVAGTTGGSQPNWAGITVGATLTDGSVTWLKVVHALEGFAAGDIIPESIWDLNFRSSGQQEGHAYSAATQEWYGIYMQSSTGATTGSVFNTTITDTRVWNDHVDDLGAVGDNLPDDRGFQLAAAGSNEQTNITGSADPVTAGGHLDTSGRRMVSNIGLEDCCGAMHQWLRDQSFRCDPDGTVQDGAKAATAYHAASPGGYPIYVKYLPDGNPYLCCNLASAATDKWITFSTDWKILLVNDANAAVGSVQLFLDEDATQPARLLAALGRGKTAYIPTNNPAYMLQITYHATPATPGVPINYDDGADNRLEFTSPTAANGTIDLALNSQAFAYYDLPGSKGSLYRQGGQGDVKLLAGGYWTVGAYAGSRGRRAYNYRWSAGSAIGARGCARNKEK